MLRLQALSLRRSVILVFAAVSIVLLVGALTFYGVAHVTADDSETDVASAFPVFERAQTDEDKLPESAERVYDSERMTVIQESTRLLDSRDGDRYYLGDTKQGLVCIIYAPGNEFANMGCGYAERVVNEGVLLGTSGANKPAQFMLALPNGYDEVVDEDGNAVGESRNGLFTLTTETASEWPDQVIVRGPAGEYELDLPGLGRDN